MVRVVDNTKINDIANSLKVSTSGMNYIGDISDLGNEIGVVVGLAFKDMTDEDITEFIHGFRHGISLTNGTH
jgi:hypothetical protein